jgi:hypothetical protein
MPTCDGYVPQDIIDRFYPRNRSVALGAVTYLYAEDDDQLIPFRTGFGEDRRTIVDDARLDSDGVWRHSLAGRAVMTGDTSSLSPVSAARAAEVAAQLGGSLDSPTGCTD